MDETLLGGLPIASLPCAVVAIGYHDIGNETFISSNALELWNRFNIAMLYLCPRKQIGMPQSSSRRKTEANCCKPGAVKNVGSSMQTVLPWRDT
jgi:hypothetical protein